MKKNLSDVITSWPFVLCLIALLVNDWALKSLFSNYFTGKLSDFAGISMIGFLLFSSFPNKKYLIYPAISIFFFWWKGPLSSPFIEFLNNLEITRFNRVIDYSDCWALTVLPLCHYIVNNITKYTLSTSRIKKIIVLPLSIATAFSIMATSIIPTYQEYTVRPTSTNEKLERKKILNVIVTVSEIHGLKCKNCNDESNTGILTGRDLTMWYSFNDSNSVSFRVEAFPWGFAIFGKSGEERANSLRRSLKSKLADNFENLEYIEKLRNNLGNR